MFGTLLESRARRQRRSGGMALSAATHLAIVGAITVTTTATATKMPLPKPVHIVVVPPTEPKPTPRPVSVQRESVPRIPGKLLVDIRIKQLIAPTEIPVDLPPLDAHTGATLDSLIAVGGSGRETRRIGMLDLDDKPSSGSWSGAELMMRLVTSAKPRYPESLRSAGVDGQVLVRFTVDTLGRVDASSIVVVRSTHELFTRAVRDALNGLRFRPAEAGGKRVPALAEMPFEFSITR